MKTLDIATSGRLAYLAALIAIETPMSRSQYVEAAKIRWRIVEDIRKALDDAGFDWRKAHDYAATAERTRRGLDALAEGRDPPSPPTA